MLPAWKPLAMAALVSAALAGYVAWTLGRAPLAVELAEAREASARQQTAIAQAYAKALLSAQQRGDRLTTQLAQGQRQIDQLQKDRRDAIAHATTGRTCLDGAALRVLHGAPGLRVAGFPEAASGAAAADAGTAADTNHTSDADIGRWAIDAGAQYEQCRQRLDALIDWHGEGATTP